VVVRVGRRLLLPLIASEIQVERDPSWSVEMLGSMSQEVCRDARGEDYEFL
jgi:hypothetical protein